MSFSIGRLFIETDWHWDWDINISACCGCKIYNLGFLVVEYLNDDDCYYYAKNPKEL